MYCSDDLRINRVDHPMILKSKDPFTLILSEGEMKIALKNQNSKHQRNFLISVNGPLDLQSIPC